MIRTLKDAYGQMVEGRSPQWPAVRKAHLATNPTCAACGQQDALNVHHIRPFHLFPDLELTPTNLITLCEAGPAHCNCHLLVGHCGNWQGYNPSVVASAAFVLNMLAQRKAA